MKKILITLSAVLICLTAQNVHSEETVRLPRPTGFVSDYVGILPAGVKQKIEALSEEVERKTQAEIAVVTVRTTKPLALEEYAAKLFKNWGIGKKGADNGVLVLVVTDDRKVRIEVGYGLEGAITDLKSKIIITDLMLPAFRENNYSLGILSCCNALAGTIAEEYNVTLDTYSAALSTPSSAKKRSKGSSLLTLLFFLLIFGFRFGTMFFIMGNRSTYWSSGGGGSFGGGFGGFGGGMSGGGGASGGW